MSQPPALTWYLALTAPQGEARAEAALALRKVTTFLPRYCRHMKRRGRMLFVERMVLPGYLLIGFEPGRERWIEVEAAPGVQGLVRHADRAPKVIPPTNVGDLMSCCVMGVFDDTAERRLGARVKFSTVKKGPLISLEERYGTIVSLSPDRRVEVLFHEYGPLHVELMTLDELEIAE